MNSRELVKKTLEFDNPQRIPRQLWLLPWANQTFSQELARLQREFPDDILWAQADLKQPLKVTGDPCIPGIYEDEWGCVFQNKQQGIIGEVKEPLIKDWQDIDKLKIPYELLTIDRDKINAFCRATDKFVLGAACPRPFERLQFIRGTEILFMDLAECGDDLSALISRLHNFYLKEFELWAQTEVDGLFFMDDWGSQQSLLISPKMWRQIFKPLYKDYIDIAHSYNKYAFMHSDGNISEILPDLIEMGLDAVNSQIFCMGVEEIGKKHSGEITFWGEIDRQHILPHGNADDVSNAVKTVYSSLFKDGGVIAQCEFGPGAKPENVYAVFKVWADISSQKNPVTSLK